MTGEEHDIVRLELRSKFYRFDDDQWKERGTGDLKILQNSQTKMSRVLLRQDQTEKIRANFFGNHPIIPYLFS